MAVARIWYKKLLAAFLCDFSGEHLLWLIGASAVTLLYNENSLLYIVSGAHCVKLNREAIKWNRRHGHERAELVGYRTSLLGPFEPLKLQTVL